MVEWILLNARDLLYYLDDFVMVGPLDTNHCAKNLNTLLAVFHQLCLPLHPNKCVGPSTCLVVLGIELDTQEQMTRLSADKLTALQELIASWHSWGWCKRQQLESLNAHQRHATKVQSGLAEPFSAAWSTCCVVSASVIIPSD